MLRATLAFGVFAATMLLPAPAWAQESPDDWHFRATAYVFMPDIKGEQSFPAPEDIHVQFGDLLDKTEFSFMGVFEARYRRVGAFADVIYLNLGDEKEGTDRLGTGLGEGVPLPPGITADLKLDIKSWIVTMAGLYRAIDTESGNLDIFAGARMNSLKTDIDYAFSDPFGPFVGPLQQGSVGRSVETWDGIVGTKGRVSFGRKREWFALGYADIGTGDSKRTWQVILAGGRRFGHVDAVAGWRKISFHYESGNPIERISYSGPVVGVSVGF